MIFDSEDLQVARGENVEVLLLGDGTNTGPRVPAAAIERFNAISGPVDVGDEVLWVLTNSPGFVDEGSTILLRASYLGNWRTENGRAVNALPARSLPRDEVVRLLREERAAEYRPDDNRGAGDPREVEEGSRTESGQAASARSPGSRAPGPHRRTVRSARSRPSARG